MPHISIVIPVYNTAPYLRRCLDSIRLQTLRDIEVICVNDASTDDSLAILHEYATDDTRFQVIDLLKNSGVSHARNAGIDLARGVYLAFVDPDDFVDPDFYKKLYLLAAKTNSDIVKGSRINVDEYGNAVHQLLNDKVRRSKFKFIYQHTTAIFRRTILTQNSVYYPDGLTNNEDAVFLLQAVYYANNIETIDDVYYRYLRRSGSLASEKYALHQWVSVLRSFELMVDFINGVTLPADDYNEIFYGVMRQMDDSGKLFGRLDSRAAVGMYAEASVKIYAKCKEHSTIDPRLRSVSRKWHDCLLAGNAAALTNYLVRLKPKQWLVADIRAGL